MSHLPNPPTTSEIQALAKSNWRTLRAVYRYANRASFHLLGLTVKLVVLVYFLLALVFLALRYIILPNVDFYKHDIERLSSSALGLPIKIERVYASWSGLRPHLFLGDVRIQDPHGQTALHLPSVSATFSWWTLFSAQLRFSSLELGRPDLDIRREPDGRLLVAGLYIDPQKKGDGKGADWLLEQREVLIREGRIRWTDTKRAAPPLLLENVNLTLRNQWRRHRAGLTATPPAAFGGPLDLRADFQHRPFAGSIADVSLWKGVLFADVQNTDLAMWKAYLDYPFELRRGVGAVRAWLDLDHAKLANFTADLSLKGVQARLGPDLQVISLRQVSGRVAAREEFDSKLLAKLPGKPSVAKLGHHVSLQDFLLETEDGKKLAVASVEGAFMLARDDKPEETRLRASALDLHTLAELATRLPLTAPQRQMLQDFAPRGAVRHFSLQWQGTYPQVQAYSVKGVFDDLGLAPQAARAARAKTADQRAQAAVPAIPGFDHLSGSIEANQKGGRIKLVAPRFQLQLPGYFDEPVMQFEQFNLRASWDLAQKNQVAFAIDELDFWLDGIKISAAGRHVLPLEAGAASSRFGNIDLKAEIDSFPLARIGRFLPKQTGTHLRDWLGKALEGGQAEQVSLRLRGDLAHFPFHAKDSQAHGEFVVRGRLKDAKLNYAPAAHAADGRSPQWPQAEAIQGSFVFERAKMEILANQASTRGLALLNVKAVIPDLLSSDGMLEIDGTAQGPLQAFFGYMNASPVAEWTSHLTADSRAEGMAKLGLKFSLPLNHAIDTKVRGVLQLVNNDVYLIPGLPLISGANGRIEFNERGVNLPGLQANFLGGGMLLSGGSQSDGNILIKANGVASVDGLRRAFSGDGVQKLSRYAQGATRYQASLGFKKRQTEITVESSLQGLALNFPSPLKKAASENLSLRFSQVSALGDDGVWRDELRASLGNMLAAKYQRQKNANGQWRVLRGGIGVNEAAPEPESGLTIHANMHTLNVDAWRTLAANVAPVASEDSTRGIEEDPLAQYLDPEVLAARTDVLLMLGKKLDNVVVGASHAKGVWQANINSHQVSGHLTWYEGGAGRGFGKVTTRLSSLIIPESAASDVTDLLEGKNTTTQIPALDVVAENFELFNKKLGRLEVLANNVRNGQQREWQIEKLSIDNPDALLQARGKWVNSDGQGQTSLNYSLQMKDAGKMLERFGFVHVLKGGEGKMDGELHWLGMPFSLDIPSLSGQLTLDMTAGQFLKVDPGAAKLLSVLSLQTLPKFLKLDFQDVFSEGFAFDGITATANISKGVLRTDNLKMRSVNATVLMDGSADIARETQNMYVVVIPEINVGTASVVYALAVNPMVGLGSYLAQLFLRNPLMKALTFQYQISGSWKEPHVAKVSPRPLPEVPQAAPPP